MFGDKQFDGVGYPTPSSVPMDRGCRTATIPADAAWYGVFMGLLETLTHEENWQQFEGGISREDAACYWAEIIDSLYLSAEEGDCVDCCPIFRRNPATGILQGSYDDGLTWNDTPEGPYVGADGPPIAPAPPALAQGSDDEDICAASWNAADVIAQFYQQTAGEAAAGLYNTVLAVNQALYSINQTLIHFIYPTESQLAQSLGFFDFDWPTYADAPTLDSTAMTALRCLLRDNASVTAGIVSFDQPAVLAGTVGALGTNPGVAVALLIGYLDQSGLDAAGGVKVNDHPDCTECGWCYTFDFTTGLAGWTIGHGTQDGSGLHAVNFDQFKLIQGSHSLSSTVVHHVEMDMDYVQGHDGGYYLGNAAGTNRLIEGTISVSGVVEWDGTATMTDFFLNIVPSNTNFFNGSAVVRSITMSGAGANPFGSDNC